MTQMNLSMKQKQTHNIENRLVVDKVWGRVGERLEWEVEVSRCKLLYREWINNKVLL